MLLQRYCGSLKQQTYHIDDCRQAHKAPITKSLSFPQSLTSSLGFHHPSHSLPSVCPLPLPPTLPLPLHHPSRYPRPLLPYTPSPCPPILLPLYHFITFFSSYFPPPTLFLFPSSFSSYCNNPLLHPISPALPLSTAIIFPFPIVASCGIIRYLLINQLTNSLTI